MAGTSALRTSGVAFPFVIERVNNTAARLEEPSPRTPDLSRVRPVVSKRWGHAHSERPRYLVRLWLWHGTSQIQRSCISNRIHGVYDGDACGLPFHTLPSASPLLPVCSLLSSPPACRAAARPPLRAPHPCSCSHVRACACAYLYLVHRWSRAHARPRACSAAHALSPRLQLLPLSPSRLSGLRQLRAHPVRVSPPQPRPACSSPATPLRGTSLVLTPRAHVCA